MPAQPGPEGSPNGTDSLRALPTEILPGHGGLTGPHRRQSPAPERWPNGRERGHEANRRLASKLYWTATSCCVALFIVASLMIPRTVELHGGGSSNVEQQYLKERGSNPGSTLQSIKDIVVNIILYLPLGVSVALALASRRPRLLSIWLLFGTLLGAAVEYMQLFFFGRISDWVDVVSRTVGYLFGFACIAVACRFFGLRAELLLGLDEQAALNPGIRRLISARFVYLCLFALALFFPFNISMSPHAIFDQLHLDRGGTMNLILDPFFSLQHLALTGRRIGLQLLALIPLALVSSMIELRRGRFSFSAAILPVVLFAVITESAKVFIPLRTTDSAIIFISTLIGIMGAVFVWSVNALRHTTPTSPCRRDPECHAAARRRWFAIGAASYFVVVGAVSWAPYRFEKDVNVFRIKAMSFFLHRTAKLERRGNTGASQITRNTRHPTQRLARGALLFFPAGLLMTGLLFAYLPRRGRIWIALAASFFATLITLFVVSARLALADTSISFGEVFAAVLGTLFGACLMWLGAANPALARLIFGTETTRWMRAA